MKTSLHIITRPLTDDEEALIRQEEENFRVETSRLRDSEVDYAELVTRIFEADVIRVW